MFFSQRERVKRSLNESRYAASFIDFMPWTDDETFDMTKIDRLNYPRSTGQ
jgi:hypothetical protein